MNIEFGRNIEDRRGLNETTERSIFTDVWTEAVLVILLGLSANGPLAPLPVLRWTQPPICRNPLGRLERQRPPIWSVRWTGESQSPFAIADPPKSFPERANWLWKIIGDFLINGIDPQAVFDHQLPSLIGNTYNCSLDDCFAVAFAILINSLIFASSNVANDLAKGSISILSFANSVSYNSIALAAVAWFNVPVILQ